MTKELPIKTILIINAGSSSIKFAVYQESNLQCLCKGQVAPIQAESKVFFTTLITGQKPSKNLILNISNHQQSIDEILKWIANIGLGWEIISAGHRVVHGGALRNEPVIMTKDIMKELRLLEPLAPLHQQHNLAAIDSIYSTHSTLPQVACFDTAFHTTQDMVQRLLPLPKKYRDKGLMRYGFHGLSYDYLVSELKTMYEGKLPSKLVIAHLGNGASICAIEDGKSKSSSMSFSTLDGLLMGSRCGAIDAGALLYLLQSEGLSADELSTCLYEESGLLGLSGISADLRDLEASNQLSAQLALDYFVDSIVKHIVSATAVLEGINTLVFSGGIGENSIYIRQQVLLKLKWLGIDLDENANKNNDVVITLKHSPIKVLVIKTDEELVIARQTKSICSIQN